MVAATLEPQISSAEAAPEKTEFAPQKPRTLAESGLSANQVEGLVLKYLLNCGVARGQKIADQVHLPFPIITDLLRRLKAEQLVVYRSTSGLNDFDYELTPTGYERARRLFEQCNYFGGAPVSLNEYIESVNAQSPTRDRPSAAQLQEALKDLQVNREIFDQLGQAISSVGAVFLYGAPGNGKSSIAERLTKAFGPTIWIPRAVDVEGEFMTIFDPTMHEELPDPDGPNAERRFDTRWVRIKRPTVIAGGELTLENLEITSRNSAGIVEAPLHLKSNCGTLVIDDFGRQRVSAKDLLNRWIVPLERKHDFLNTPSGKKVRVPFNQLIIFATNLEPKELVDEAFLRRIPYKIEAIDPSEEEFRKLLSRLSAQYEIEHIESTVDHLIQKHYREAGRAFRYCHARDLILQVKNHCVFLERKPELSIEAIDAAVRNYFVTM
ncbi:MAG: AAA family ATPase [Planctomycetaceae bacterium]